MMRNVLVLMMGLFVALQARDVALEIPEIVVQREGYEKIEDVAQYGGADWRSAIGIVRGITLEEAYKIADENWDIDFFFYTKGGQMVLNAGNDYRLFRYGDAVFFSGKPWWGSAPGLADGYVKTK